MRLVTTAFAFTEPRFDQTRTQPPEVMPFLLRELLRDLDEELRLHHRVRLDVLGPEVEVLGQPVGRRRIGEVLGVAELLPCRP